MPTITLHIDDAAWKDVSRTLFFRKVTGSLFGPADDFLVVLLTALAQMRTEVTYPPPVQAKKPRKRKKKTPSRNQSR